MVCPATGVRAGRSRPAGAAQLSSKISELTASVADVPGLLRHVRVDVLADASVARRLVHDRAESH